MIRPFYWPETRYLPYFEMAMADIIPNFLFSAVPRTIFPLFPTSKSTIFPKEVPTARYLMLFDVTTVGIPTPFAVESNAAVTLFNTMNAIFLI